MIYGITQVFGAQLSEVPLWLKMPMPIFNGIIKKKKEYMKKQYGTTKNDYEKYESQDQAEDEFLMGNLPKEVYEQLEL